MENCAAKLLFLGVCATLALPALAKPPQDFKASLELSRNGKPMGESTFSMSSTDDGWTMNSHTRGTRGLARLVGLDEQSESHGDWDGGSARPLAFERNVKHIKREHWDAQFDWEAGTVKSVHPDGENLIELKNNTVDESTLGLRIRMGLARGREEWKLNVLDEDEIEVQTFRLASVEPLQTALGCVTAHRVDKIRHASSTRYTRQYYAEEFGFVPVLIEHGKTDGDHLESRIVSLELGGESVEALPDC